MRKFKAMPRPGSMLQKCRFLSFWPFLAKSRISNKNPQIRHYVPHFTNALFFRTFFPTCFEKKVVFSRKKSLLHLKKSTFSACISKGPNSRLTCGPIFEEMLPFFPFVENSHNWLKFIVNFIAICF